MKNIISSFAVCFVLFLLNCSITWGNQWGNYRCETGGYDGANPFDKQQIENKAAKVEAQLYDELGYFNKGWNLIMWNFNDHLGSLIPSKKMNLCKCVYTTITGKSDFTNSNEDVLIRPDVKMTVQKLGPKKQTLKRETTLTEIHCKFNDISFNICEGYTPRVCLNCYDIYVITGVANQSNVGTNEKQWEGKVIGGVNMVRFGNLLIRD